MYFSTHRQWASWWWWRPFRPSCSPKRCQIPRKWDWWRWSRGPWNTFPPWSKWQRKRSFFPPKAAANLWRILEAFNTTRGGNREENLFSTAFNYNLRAKQIGLIKLTMTDPNFFAFQFVSLSVKNSCQNPDKLFAPDRKRQRKVFVSVKLERFFHPLIKCQKISWWKLFFHGSIYIYVCMMWVGLIRFDAMCANP